MGGQARKGAGWGAKALVFLGARAASLVGAIRRLSAEVSLATAFIIIILSSGVWKESGWNIIAWLSVASLAMTILLNVGFRRRDIFGEKILGWSFSLTLLTWWVALLLLFGGLIVESYIDAGKAHLVNYMGWLVLALVFSRGGGCLLKQVFNLFFPVELRNLVKSERKLLHAQRIYRGLCYFVLGFIYLSSRLGTFDLGTVGGVTGSEIQVMEAFLTFVIFDTAIEILWPQKVGRRALVYKRRHASNQ